MNLFNKLWQRVMYGRWRAVQCHIKTPSMITEEFGWGVYCSRGLLRASVLDLVRSNMTRNQAEYRANQLNGEL